MRDEPEAETTDAGAGAAPRPEVVVERPPPGLAQGKYAFPAWGIAMLGGVVVALGVAYLVWRWFVSRRR